MKVCIDGGRHDMETLENDETKPIFFINYEMSQKLAN